MNLFGKNVLSNKGLTNKVSTNRALNSKTLNSKVVNFKQLSTTVVGIGMAFFMQHHAQAADNKKIMPYGLYQTPDKTIWMRCALGQTWNGKTCAGKAGEYTWQQANALAKKHVHKGIDGWRLPTIKELHALVNCSTGFAEKTKIPVKFNKKIQVDNLCFDTSDKPTINQTVFPNTGNQLYWSGTTDPLQNGFAWYTFFGGGHSDIYNMSTKNLVRLVKVRTKKTSK